MNNWLQLCHRQKDAPRQRSVLHLERSATAKDSKTENIEFVAQPRTQLVAQTFENADHHQHLKTRAVKIFNHQVQHVAMMAHLFDFLQASLACS